jgi:hypothetical protein
LHLRVTSSGLRVTALMGSGLRVHRKLSLGPPYSRPEPPEFTPSSTGQRSTGNHTTTRRKSGLGPSGPLAPPEARPPVGSSPGLSFGFSPSLGQCLFSLSDSLSASHSLNSLALSSLLSLPFSLSCFSGLSLYESMCSRSTKKKEETKNRRKKK